MQFPFQKSLFKRTPPVSESSKSLLPSILHSNVVQFFLKYMNCSCSNVSKMVGLRMSSSHSGLETSQLLSDTYEEFSYEALQFSLIVRSKDQV